MNLLHLLFALGVFGRLDASFRAKAIRIAKSIHPRFVIPNVGVIWKMREDLSGTYPGYGLGASDAYLGYVIYRLLHTEELRDEINELEHLVERNWRSLYMEQDLGLGMMLWLSSFYPDEPWAEHQRTECLKTLDTMWIEPPGYFCRHAVLPRTRYAFTNYGISLGLQAVHAWPERVTRLNRYFEGYMSGDQYDLDPITHVMGCVSNFPGGFVPGLRVSSIFA